MASNLGPIPQAFARAALRGDPPIGTERWEPCAGGFTNAIELVRGDTCQRWHRDLNVCRTIVTYTGPGTHVAHEDGVTQTVTCNTGYTIREALPRRRH